MERRGAGRLCARCEHVVIDLTRATRARALEVLRAGGACVRVEADEDGAAIFREPIAAGLRRAASGLAVAALVGACEPDARGAASAETAAAVEPLESDEGEAADASPASGPAAPSADRAAAPFGAPMIPIEHGGPGAASCAHDDALAHSAQDGEGAARAEGPEDAEPAPEQRARTRRKRRGQTTAHHGTGPGAVPMMGFMMLD